MAVTLQEDLQAVCIYVASLAKRRSEWPRGLKRGFAAVRLLGLRVRIPPRTWMSVS